MLADYFEESPGKAMYRVEEFEQKVKERFIKEPGQMRLLIVVDKLLVGFDEPRNTVLYVDKSLKDHALLQAIARVNRTSDGKFSGYIVDYYGLSDYLTEVGAKYPTLDSEYSEAKTQEYLYKVEHEKMPSLEKQRMNFLSKDFDPNNNWWGSMVTIN